MSDYRFEEEEFATSFNGKTLIRIYSQAKSHWRWLVGFLIAIGIVSTLDSYFTYLSKRIIDEGILGGNADVLLQIITIYGSLIVVQATAVCSFIYLTGVLGQRVQYDMRKELFNHLQRLSFSYYDKTPVGWIMSRVTSDTERIADLMTWGTLDITWAIMNISTAIIFMTIINWKLMLVVMAFIPIIAFVAVWFRQRILVEYRKVRKFNSQITGNYNENITGVRVVKALRREEENLREFDGLAANYYDSAYRAAWYSALFLPSVQLISAFAIGGVAWYSGGQIDSGGITIGGLQAFISYIVFMLWPIQDIARVFASMQHAIASAERTFSLMDAVPDIQDKPTAKAPENIRGDIVFDNVSFYYEKDKPVLQNFSLTVHPGETIALVGPTGGGKSTIVNLLCRFYEPKQGTISFAGTDYTDLTMYSIQSQLGIVLQTPHLFSGTIRENIRYGRLEATDEEIEAAAKVAGAHEFITKLEKGYEEEVGEGGVLLSVGQKQLLSLARAILADPEIFIMDEATSSVDTLTESLIQQGMERILHDRTSFVIAHRLSTIKQANRILVIENGHISEMGSHAELLRAGGHYYRLYTTQFRNQREQALTTEGAPN